MTFTIPLWSLPFLVLAAGFAVAIYTGQSLGMAALMLLITVLMVVSFALGIYLGPVVT